MSYLVRRRYCARSSGSESVLYDVFISALRARALLCAGSLGYLSGWCWLWRSRNSWRREGRGMLNRPVGGGPEGRVCGKSV